MTEDTDRDDADGETTGDAVTVDIEALRERIAGNEFHERHDLQIREAEPGRAVLAIPGQEWLTNLSGDMHGGVLATLIDTASALAIRTTFEDHWNVGLATTDMNISYVRPAREGVQSEAEVVRVGDSLAVTDAEVTGLAPDGERKVVAVGGTTYRVVPGVET